MGDCDQKIVGFDVYHLSVPVNARRDHGIGSVAGAVDVVLLRLRAEDGTTGWGEASSWSVFTGSAEAAFAALDRYIRPLVTGARVCDMASVLDIARRVVAHATEAKAALETAWLDLSARLAGVPVHQLLGGKARDTIPLSVSIADPVWDNDRALLDRITDDGIGIVKLKTGFRGHAYDIMRLEALRRDWPELSVRVDYNQGLDPVVAEACVRDVVGFAPDFIEQPVAAHHFDLMARLRDACGAVPLLADESIFGPEDMHRAVGAGIADGVSVKIMKSGGLIRAQTVARMAAAAGWAAYGGDMFETGLAHLAGTHMIAATPEITLGCEFYQASYFLARDILETPFEVSQGQVIVPDGPGLGPRPDPARFTPMVVATS